LGLPDNGKVTRKELDV